MKAVGRLQPTSDEAEEAYCVSLMDWRAEVDENVPEHEGDLLALEPDVVAEETKVEREEVSLKRKHQHVAEEEDSDASFREKKTKVKCDRSGASPQSVRKKTFTCSTIFSNNFENQLQVLKLFVCRLWKELGSWRRRWRGSK